MENSAGKKAGVQCRAAGAGHRAAGVAALALAARPRRGFEFGRRQDEGLRLSIWATAWALVR